MQQRLPRRRRRHPTCAAGRCGATCSAGRGDPTANAANGCENTLDSNAHCGACNRACAPANAIGMCVAGACAVAACLPFFADCDGNAANGCEVDTRTNASHCGGCGNACPALPGGAASCAGSVCGLACAAGRGDCDGNPINGCEVDTSTTNAHCGACNNACAVASSRRVHAGACGVASCATGYGNCDGDAANGCETALAGNVAHCGACGNACPAGGICNAGAARARSGERCAAAPASTSGDARSCGACGNACASRRVCSGGRCGAACSSGATNCSGQCVLLGDDRANCGACGNACGADAVARAGAAWWWRASTAAAAPTGRARPFTDATRFPPHRGLRGGVVAAGDLPRDPGLDAGVVRDPG
ncbi:MAG: hypothetical protein R3A52_18615 [Polyangiales bacterium]